MAGEMGWTCPGKTKIKQLTILTGTNMTITIQNEAK